MKLFGRAKLLLGGALAIGTLGGLIAAAAPAHAVPGPGPLPSPYTEHVYIEPWNGCSKPLTVTGTNYPVSPAFDGAGEGDLWNYNTGAFVDGGPAQDWGGGVVGWQETRNPGPGTYYATITDIYFHTTSSGLVTFTC
jgi:hypothetical protein